jgi:hypothetical protein
VTPGGLAARLAVLDTQELPARLRANARTLSGGLIVLGMMSFSGAGIIGALLIWLRRRS